jgi:hypothetical protein
MVGATGVGGEHGQRAVVSARIAGLLKVQHEELEQQHEQRDMDELVVSEQAWKRMRADQVEEDEDEDIERQMQQKRNKRFSVDEMDEMIRSWKETSERLKRCNAEHLRAVLVSIVYLADVLVGKRNVETFSMVVQGAGGTGKTASIIGAVKEFVEYVANASGDDSIADCVMVLAPTNLAALAIRGQTLDKGIFNRRGQQNLFRGDGVVKLLLIDEFSMVSCSWIAMIEEALRGDKGSTSNEANLFGGISVVWIGDVHQLPPVFGHAVFSASRKMTNSDRHGQQLWTGANWKLRKSLAVIVTQQYRMAEPLAGIAQRFADGMQTVDDAVAIRARLMKRGAAGAKTEDEWMQQLSQNRAKVLTGENNIKAAINWEIVEAMRGGKSWLEWKSNDAEGLREKEDEMGVVDQLEPMQCVWKWMPVICLENMDGDAGVCNGALCWIVHVVGEPGNCCKIVAVAASNKEDAQNKAQTAANLVALKQVVREGRRAFPICPVWAMTLHKVQGATLDEAVIVLGRRMCAHSVYMALSRVRELDCLWLLEDMPTSLFLALRFDKCVNAEVQRLMQRQNATCVYLNQHQNDWKSLTELITDAASGISEQESLSRAADGNEQSRMISEVQQWWETKETKVLRNFDWLGDKTSIAIESFVEASLMMRCSVMMRDDVLLKAPECDLSWANLDVWTSFSLEQQLQIVRVWKMQRVWSKQGHEWTSKSELGKLQFRARGSVLKKERENDWRHKFPGVSCDATMKRIRRE